MATRKQLKTIGEPPVTALVSDIRRLIDEAKAGLAATVNSALTLLYWRVGQRISTEVLKGERAGYGDRLSRRWRDNWKLSTDAASAPKICATCCALPMYSSPRRLSTH